MTKNITIAVLTVACGVLGFQAWDRGHRLAFETAVNRRLGEDLRKARDFSGGVLVDLSAAKIQLGRQNAELYQTRLDLKQAERDADRALDLAEEVTAGLEAMQKDGRVPPKAAPKPVPSPKEVYHAVRPNQRPEGADLSRTMVDDLDNHGGVAWMTVDGAVVFVSGKPVTYSGSDLVRFTAVVFRAPAADDRLGLHGCVTIEGAVDWGMDLIKERALLAGRETTDRLVESIR